MNFRRLLLLSHDYNIHIFQKLTRSINVPMEIVDNFIYKFPINNLNSNIRLSLMMRSFVIRLSIAISISIAYFGLVYERWSSAAELAKLMLPFLICALFFGFLLSFFSTRRPYWSTFATTAPAPLIAYAAEFLATALVNRASAFVPPAGPSWPAPSLPGPGHGSPPAISDPSGPVVPPALTAETFYDHWHIDISVVTFFSVLFGLICVLGHFIADSSRSAIQNRIAEILRGFQADAEAVEVRAAVITNIGVIVVAVIGLIGTISGAALS